ncbi:MAG: chemotaxis protein CheB [Planctomycetales bacterium]|nr:chemotaxis protein CheB [Planctomycetales bacterium]MBN8625077.1 chemotaxis protein CheB [Planctomycetota bacterium]
MTIAPSDPCAQPAPSELADCCIAVGTSTGGPPALARLFSQLPSPMPPIVVVQHMPQAFTRPFAERLDALGAIEVREAQDGDILRPNLALIAPGGKHLRIRRRAGLFRAVVFDGDLVSGHKPSVDVMMKSVAECFGRRCLGVIMTGMGHDGVDGCLALRNRGGFVIGQDEGTSDVYGMNKAAFVAGAVNAQAPLDEIAQRIASHVNRKFLQTSKPQTSSATAEVN